MSDRRLVSMVGRLVADKGVLVPSAGAVRVFLLLAALAVVYIGLALHQSSIGYWEHMYPEREVAQAIALGSAKSVRSDEWNTMTPWALSQVSHGFPQSNPNVGAGQSPLMIGLPVAGWPLFIQPKFWGLWALDVDHGFSVWWAYKTLGLLTAFFWMLLILSRGNTTLSLAGALWVLGSSYTQWWLSSNITDMLLSFALAVIGGHYLLLAKHWARIFAGAALIWFSFSSAVLQLYPPFQVPLGLLVVFILGGTLLQLDNIGRMTALRWRVAALAGCLVACSVTLFLFYLDTQQTVDATLATVYPGRRVAAGGDLPLFRLFYGYFEGFRLSQDSLPLPPTNASEAASFVLVFPFLFALLDVRSLLARSNAVLCAVLLYILIVVGWTSLAMPEFARMLLAKTGWSLSPGPRGVIGIGIASVIATVMAVEGLRSGKLKLRADLPMVVILVATISTVGLYGFYLRSLDPVFFTGARILGGIMLCVMFVASIAYGSSRLFAAAVAFVIAIPMLVNPLQSGISSISGKPVLLQAVRLSGGENQKWLVIGDFVVAQGLKANGLAVVGGSQFLPEPKMIEALDPALANKSVWNRYAHFIFRSRPGTTKPIFVSPQGDVVEVSVDVCSSNVARLGVTRIAYAGEIPEQDKKCLRLLPGVPDSGITFAALQPATK